MNQKTSTIEKLTLTLEELLKSLGRPTHFSDWYKLPHDLNRPGQLDTFADILRSEAKYVIVQAPTGSGKTAWVAAASLAYRVMACVEKKALQLETYYREYQIDPVYGKNEYECYFGGPADLCGENDECVEKGKECPYRAARLELLESNRVCINYTKFLVDPYFVDSFKPDILFLDECHRVKQIVIDFTGFSLPWSSKFYSLEPTYFPAGDFEQGREILKEIVQQVGVSEPPEFLTGTPKKKNPEYIEWERLYRKVGKTLTWSNDAYEGHQIGWFFEATTEAFACKPLTARYRFPDLIGKKARKIVLMSATPGNPSVLAESLGLPKGSWEFIETKEIFKRTIWDMRAPAMKYGKPGSKALEERRSKQSRIITKTIKQFPTDWTGLIHFNSKAQSLDMFNRLGEQFPNQVWMPGSLKLNKDYIGMMSEKVWKKNLWGMSTIQQRAEWDVAKREGKRIAIVWSFHEGFSFPDEKFCIVGKVPYGFLGDMYGKTRMKILPQEYAQDAANGVEQMLGRILRGIAKHYGINAKFVGIADGAWRNIRSNFTPAFDRSIVTMNLGWRWGNN